jgi:choice-of-anchor C domain-containing protein
MAAMLTTALAATMLGPVTTASASAGVPADSSPTNLVVNGSFEDPSSWQTEAIDEYPGGSTGITGWTVGGDSVDVTGSSYWTAQDGEQSVDLSGSAPGSVSQTVATTPGSVYTLTWYMAGNDNCGQPIKTMDVSWDGSQIYAPTFDTDGFDNQDMGWAEEQIEVGATGASSALEFADGTADGSQCGAVLDDVSLTTAELASPVFVRDSPSLQALAGSPYSASFYASGVPSYALIGAPAWLSVTPTGAVVGTPPTGTTSFSYSLSAGNVDGVALAGPYTVAVQAASTATGTVVDGGIAADPVVGTTVQACVSGTEECQQTTTASDGTFSVPVPAGGSVVLSAYPLPGSGDTSTSTDTLTVPAGGLQNETISLDGITPLPGGLQINGTDAPTIYWANPAAVTATGCANGFGTVTAVGLNTATGQYVSDTEPLAETPPGSGNYTGTLPAQEPVHGPIQIKSSISCLPQSPIVPDSGPASGGNTVVLTGSGFTGATGVTFGAVPAQSFTVASDQSIEAVAPPGTGTVSVSVQTGSSSTTVDTYTYTAVRSVVPATGPAAGGTNVVITGTGLSSATAVYFGTTSAPFTQVSDTEIDAVSPAGTGTQDITVDTLGGNSPTGAADRFTYAAGGGSSKSAKSATSAAAGRGSGLAARPSAPTTAVSATELASLTALAKQIMASQATAKAGTIHPADSFFFPSCSSSTHLDVEVSQCLSSFMQSAAPNWIAAVLSAAHDLVHPTCADTSQAVSSALQALLQPLINKIVSAAQEALVPEVLEFFAPLLELGIAGAIALAAIAVAAYLYISYWVQNTIGNAISGFVDALFAGLNCDPSTPGGGAFNPNTLIDPSGTVLDTNGNPIDDATVTILRADTAAGPFAPLSPAEPGIEPAVNPQTTDSDGTFHWDVMSGWYEIQASAPGCTDATDPDQTTSTIGPYPVPPPQVGLIVTMACAGEAPPPTPSVTGLSASSGPPSGGSTVTVTGAGFTPASTVDFGTSAATAVTFLSPQDLTVTAPSGSGSVDVTVRNGSTASATSVADQYFFGSAPTVTGLGTTSGPPSGGTTVTVDGTGFTGASGVSFGGVPAASFTVASGTQIQATTPADSTGTVDVQVTTPAGVSTDSPADQFTYSGTAPAFTADTPPATATVGQPYTYTYTASGSPAPTFSVASGSLPPGVTLNPATGVLSGTPTASGGFTFTVQAGNGTGTPALSPAATITVAAPSGPAIDQQATGTGTTTVTTHLSTTVPGDLIVAFVSGDGPASATQKAKVTGGGLTWTLSQRTDNGYGTAEIWTARAAGTLSNAAITSALTQTGYGEALTVVAFSDAPGTGHTAGAWAAKGAPTGSLTTSTAGSRVFAVGNDWTASAPRTVGANQTLLTQSTDARGDTYWVQYLTAPTPIAGTSVTINDTAPTQDRWNLALVEID